MLDSKYLRHHFDEIIFRLERRHFSFDQTSYLELEKRRKSLQASVQSLQQKANDCANSLGAMKRHPTHYSKEQEAIYLEESRVVKIQLQTELTELNTIQQQQETLLLRVPNLPDPSTPYGKSSKDNQCIRAWGEVPIFSFTPKDHIQLASGHANALMSFDQAVNITGSRFVVLKGALAKLERALIQWMLDVHTEQHGYTEVAVPYLVNQKSLQTTGQLPLFEEDLFRLQSPDHWYLTPTGEVPLTNLAQDRIFEPNELPTQYVAYTPCFRSEAGSYGKDVKGMIRQHQFDKVELVHFTTQEQAADHLELLTQAAEVILQQLALPYRVMSLCTGDLGFASAKTYDLEVWLPGQSMFREISSCSYMSDFQGRRLKARWRCPKTKQLKTVHTLNGSALAVGRTLVAILENHQKEDGSIQVPKVLIPYMKGTTLISPLR